MAQAVSGESAATLSSPVWLVDRVPSAECRAAGQPLRLPHAVAGPLPGDSCRPAAPAPQRALINVPPPSGGGPPRGSAEPRGERRVGSQRPRTRVRLAAGPPAAALPVRPFYYALKRIIKKMRWRPLCAVEAKGPRIQGVLADSQRITCQSDRRKAIRSASFCHSGDKDRDRSKLSHAAIALALVFRSMSA